MSTPLAQSCAASTADPSPQHSLKGEGRLSSYWPFLGHPPAPKPPKTMTEAVGAKTAGLLGAQAPCAKWRLNRNCTAAETNRSRPSPYRLVTKTLCARLYAVSALVPAAVQKQGVLWLGTSHDQSPPWKVCCDLPTRPPFELHY